MAAPPGSLIRPIPGGDLTLPVIRKLWRVLPREQRPKALAMLGLMLIGMVLETLGIGLVIPVLALMTQNDLTVKYPFLAPWFARLGNPSTLQLVLGGMLMLVLVYLVKAIFLAYITWRQERFVSELRVELSQRLFAGYLRQPYTFHLQRNSAQLIFNTTTQSAGVASVVQQSLMLGTELLVLIGISGLLLSVEPFGALLVVTTLGVAGFGFNRLTRGHILRWGKAFKYHEELRLQHLQQGLGSAKDVKLLGREDDFLAQFLRHTGDSARVGWRQATLIALPRLWLEVLAVSGLALLVFVMIQQGKPLEALLPTLGLFGAAAFRIMPSVNRVLGALQSVRYTLPVIDTLHSELGLLTVVPPQNSARQLTFNSVLELDRVSFRYPATETAALRAINLSIPHGACVGFIGGSGAGKSTLVDTILGLLPPSDGTVKIDGADLQFGLRSWQDQIGYVPQTIFLTDDTLRRNVAFGLAAGQIDDRAVWHAIHAAQLDEFVAELPDGLETKVGERGIRLSGGQRQRIGIARALYHDPPVLVLDEATSSLDTATERGVMEAVRALRGTKTILIVAHRISTVEQCDRLYRLEHGRVVEEGNTAEMLARYIGAV